MTTRTDHAVCMLCEAICGIEVEHDGRTVHAVRGDARDPFSRGHICPKGVALADVQNDPDRVRTPLRRRGDRWEEVGWDEALDEVARRLVAIQELHGRDAVAVYRGNPTGHSYAATLTFGLLMDALRTRNFYSAGSVDALPRQLASLEEYGNQATIPVPDIDRTDFLLVLGANPLVSNGSVMTAPDVKRRLRDLRERGAKLVVVDPRYTETAEVADRHLFIRPGGDAFLLAAMLHTIFAEGLVELRHVGPLLDGFESLPARFAPFSPERVARRAGIDAETIRALAREFATAPSAVCYGRIGTCVQEFGATATWLIDVLNVVTGNLDRPGGAMFTTPAVDLPTLAKTLGLGGSFDRHRSRVSGLPEFTDELPVAAFAEEMETPGEGQIRALVTHAGNPVLSLPNGPRLSRAIEELDFVVAMDIYRNETTRHADYILPSTFGLERDEYPVVSQALAVRNVAHYGQAVLDKPAGSLHDWEILVGLAERIGRARGGFERWSRAALAALVRRIGPRGALRLFLRLGPQRVTLGDLDRNPHGIDLGPLEPRLPAMLGKDARIRIAPERFVADLARVARGLDAPPDDELVLIGRRALRSNNSWMHNSERLVSGRRRCVLWMHPDDAAARGLSTGQNVVVKSRVGEIELPVELTETVMPGVVCMPHGWGHHRAGAQLRVAGAHAGVSVNDVVDDARIDPVSGTSVLNGVPVSVSAVAA